MSFELNAAESARAGFARMILEQLDGALDSLEHGGAADPAVHDARKRCKRVRAAARIGMGVIGRKAARRVARKARDVGRTLSAARDAVVMSRTLGSLVTPGIDAAARDAIDQAREALEARRPACDVGAAIDSARAARAVVEGWDLDSDGRWSDISEGIRRIYARGRRDFRAAQADANADAETGELHDWRKRVKELWHALEILGPIRPGSVGPLAEQAHALANLLGDEHDLAVLDDALAGAEPPGGSEASERIRPLVAARRMSLRRQALELAEPLFEARPRDFVGRLGVFWSAWASEREAARLA